MKNKILVIVVSMFGMALNAQTLSDVLRPSFTNPTGSARFLGAGGSMGALGADYAVIGINPAGLGAYWTSEFVISPSILSSTTNSVLGNNTTNGRSVASLRMDNFGIVINRKPRTGLLKSFNVAIGMNRIADFNNEFTYSAITNGTIVERFTERANGNSLSDLDDFEGGLAFDAGAVYAPDESNNYINDFIDLSDGSYPFDVPKGQDVDQSGGINELLFGMAGNLGDRFLIGATLGVPYLNYESVKVYNENDDENEIPGFNSLEYREYLNTTGLGFNFKAGLIAKLNKNISIGGAIHSPTVYTLTDNYNSQLTYNFTDQGNTQELTKTSPNGSFRYRLNTPWKVIGSAAFKKKVGKLAGFVNADVEWIDYRNGALDLARFSTSVDDQLVGEDVNEQVESQLLSALNLKIGGELAYEKFRVRTGYNMIGSPYAADEGVFFPAFSLGLGWREDRYYFDVGWRTQRINEGYIPYQVLDDDRLQVVENSIKNNKLAVTLGFQF
ncbi:hypothetical protein [Portibacter marinus]|uniref:hypothetical protein n=1 Tax=Portibacter marinus TaxID=2898660 RepID=UPI001F24CD58|nr:hypothetical protein [Portibacter marinus]